MDAHAETTALPASFWDPLGDGVSESGYTLEYLDLKNRLKDFQDHPWILRSFLIASSLLFLVLLFGCLYLFLNYPGLDPEIFIVLFFPGVIFFNAYKYLKNLQQDVLLLLLCQQNHWVYKPNQDEEKIERLIQHYPEIFDFGHDQRLTDQIWGKTGENTGEFWVCSYEYTVGTKKQKQTFEQSILSVKLNKPNPIPFHLERQGLLKFEGIADTESQEFNKTFRIRCESKEPDAINKIMMILSPSVIVRIIDAVCMYPVKIKSLYFYRDILFIIGEKALFSPKYTNFFLNTKIDSRDETHFLATIGYIIDIPTEMVRFM